MPLIHASCVVVGGIGVLIRGASGSGKSDLALRLIDAGASLVADDYCEAEALAGRLVVRPPPTIAGKLEVRGFGIVDIAHLPSTTVGLIVDLVASAEIERLPDPRGEGVLSDTIEGVRLPRLRLDPTHASSVAKVRLALKTRPNGMS
ncbi:MAG: HPr kinase/phosphatase C-terminal domain-containing protein [Rhodospirillaceae bacterium]|nr:HPr kinase/phosphatase C-terminal domain-containing protein [Rhodospirillaceae bacterium]